MRPSFLFKESLVNNLKQLDTAWPPLYLRLCGTLATEFQCSHLYFGNNLVLVVFEIGLLLLFSFLCNVPEQLTMVSDP
jgi:hypothetical protein